jgi:hypothetical protein
MAGLAGTIVAEGSLYAAIGVTSSTPKAAVALDCAVLDTGSSGPETRIHVTNGSSYEGSAVVTFSDGTAKRPCWQPRADKQQPRARSGNFTFASRISPRA